MIRKIGYIFLLFGFAACSEPEEPKLDSSPVRLVSAVDPDPHSFANPHEFLVSHVDLDLDVNFDLRILEGTATLTVNRKDETGEVLIVDTRDLTINSVALLTDKDTLPLTYSLREADPNLGSALEINLPLTADGEFRVSVEYATQPKASGLQWLNARQTAGKQHPFLFTQSQAIHARSWIPLQDSPGVRVTYQARIRTPIALRAVMSADNQPDAELDGDFSFVMPQAVPSYLIALGVGDLVFKSMGEVTGVYAEPSILDAAAKEFEDTEEMLRIAEGMYGDYRWGRYDLLILPPSFPFGGMENPRLSFITPTVIAGDKSLVSLIAHELAHSWSGNLVTNATWRDLWLNEGFTSYVTSRIMEEVYGEPRAAMEDSLSTQDLRRDMKDLTDNDQILAIDLQGRDPDDVFSRVPYVKGKLFLMYLEAKFGRDKFDDFMRKYFDTFAFQSISTDQFIDYLNTELLQDSPKTVSKKVIETWIFEPGLPVDAPAPQSDAFDRVDTQQKAWLDGDVDADALDTQAWTVHEWLHFLNALPVDVGSERMSELDAEFDLSESTNNEIVHVWLLRAVTNNYQPGLARLEDYLVSIGRRKLITPLYEVLAKTEAGRTRARQIYAKARDGYHPLAVGTVDKILNTPD